MDKCQFFYLFFLYTEVEVKFMKSTCEIYLTKKHVSAEDWREFIKTIANYNGILRKWKIIITNDKNLIRYFVETNCSLPATINHLDSFLLKPTANVLLPKASSSLFNVPKLGSNIIDLINTWEIKKKGTLEYFEISFF